MKKLSKKQKYEIAEAMGEVLEDWGWQCHVKENLVCDSCFSSLEGQDRYCHYCGKSTEGISDPKYAVNELFPAFLAGLEKYKKSQS
jgi:hypothetical protein